MDPSLGGPRLTVADPDLAPAERIVSQVWRTSRRSDCSGGCQLLVPVLGSDSPLGPFYFKQVPACHNGKQIWASFIWPAPSLCGEESPDRPPERELTQKKGPQRSVSHDGASSCSPALRCRCSHCPGACLLDPSAAETVGKNLWRRTSNQVNRVA